VSPDIFAERIGVPVVEGDVPALGGVVDHHGPVDIGDGLGEAVGRGSRKPEQSKSEIRFAQKDESFDGHSNPDIALGDFCTSPKPKSQRLKPY